MRIVYQKDGVQAVLSPAENYLATLDPGWTDQQKGDHVALKDLPAGTAYQIVADDAVPVAAVTRGQINAERDRRIGAGMSYTLPAFTGVRDGGTYIVQTAPGDLTNLLGLHAMASDAIELTGMQGGNFFWTDPAQVFAFWFRDNKGIPMDAPEVRAMTQAVGLWKSALFTKAKTLKNKPLLDPPEEIPANYTNDIHWT